MKLCEKCGHFIFSKQEQKIYECLPGTTSFIAETLKIKRKIVLQGLYRLEKYGKVYRFDKQGKSIYWNK